MRTTTTAAIGALLGLPALYVELESDSRWATYRLYYKAIKEIMFSSTDVLEDIKSHSVLDWVHGKPEEFRPTLKRGLYQRRRLEGKRIRSVGDGYLLVFRRLKG